MRNLAVVALALIPLGCTTRRDQERVSAPVDWKQVEQGLGKPGILLPGGVYRLGFARSDLHVTVGSVAVKPALALGSWLAFRQVTDTDAMVMGDLVLLEGEVGPVIDKLQEAGIAQTALHNHLQRESPHVLYMHIAGRGSPARLATALHAALERTATPLTTGPAAPVPAIDLDTAQIGQILGFHGTANGGVYQVGVPRVETVTVEGTEVPAAMGVATAINFQPTAGGQVAVTGDFVLIASEVNPVLRALRSSGIEVTALHSHMVAETPRLFFMHFWGNADALTLARGLRAALDRMNVRKA